MWQRITSLGNIGRMCRSKPVHSKFSNIGALLMHRFLNVIHELSERNDCLTPAHALKVNAGKTQMMVFGQAVKTFKSCPTSKYRSVAFSRPALKLRRCPINAPKRREVAPCGAVQYTYFHYTALHT